MNTKAVALVMILGLCTVPAVAQEQGTKSGSGLSAWLTSLSKKIERVVARKAPPPSATSVAGVRGAKQQGKGKLYWKGKAGDEAVTEEELTAFKAAIDRAQQGDRAAAVKELENFMAQYPDSPLIPDAAKTVKLVQAEAPEAKPAQ